MRKKRKCTRGGKQSKRKQDEYLGKHGSKNKTWFQLVKDTKQDNKFKKEMKDIQSRKRVD